MEIHKHFFRLCISSNLVLSCVQLFWPHGQQSASLLCPWDSPGKNTGAGCHFLLQGIFLTPGIEPMSPVSPALAGGFFTTEPPGKPASNLLVSYYWLKQVTWPSPGSQWKGLQSSKAMGMDTGRPLTGAVTVKSVSHSCWTHCNLMDRGSPGSSVHGILQ